MKTAKDNPFFIHSLRALVAVSAFACTAHGQDLLHDAFNDGSLGVNTSGVGGGFTYGGQGSGVAVFEGADNATFAPTNASQLLLKSDASFDPFGTNATTATFTLGLVPTSANCLETVGYRLSSANNLTNLYNGGGVSSLVIGYNFGHGGFLNAIDSSGNATTLASFTFNDYNALSGLGITLVTTATTYSLNFSAGYVVNSGAMSGALTGIDPTSGLYNLDLFDQQLDGGSGTTVLQIDSVDVTTVPEPSSFALIGGGVLILAYYRARRSRC